EEEAPMSISLDDLNASPSMDLDLGGFSAAPGPPPPMQDRAAPAAEEDGGDDLDFITEHLTEAEVFAKYGLAEKATEHLRAVIDRAPKHLPAHEKLYRILLDEGDTAGGRSAAMQYVGLLEEKGDREAISTVQNEFTSRGQSLSIAPAAPKRAAASP